ncbi:MAG: cation:proton antiporter [Anaerolineae bacterium]
MTEILGIPYEPNILTIIGLLIAVSFLGSKLFQRVGIPQVVGFIVVGVLLGPSFLHVVPLSLSEDLSFISEIALGPFAVGRSVLYQRDRPGADRL